ncbi:nuclear transport factor 2 family protein [Sphingobium cloacae]|nr:ester cyclase [Sphingobium cloacae]BAV67007.1 hypothetical protein SCLO_7000070 [Sphingobium cloacae]
MSEQHDVEANRELVLRFYQALERGDFSLEGILFDESYKQHSVMAGDGVKGLKEMAAWMAKEWPDRKLTIHQTICEGDKVACHVHFERWPGDPGLAAVDIFRVENGKVVEHWDVVQEIPTEFKHNNGMF